MNNILSILIIISFLTLGRSTELNTLNLTEYEENLNLASELYLEKKEIPDSVLLKLVPENHNEFGLYYGTTEPDHKLGETDFFYDTTRLIFEQVTSKKNNDFYLPSLKLISFADGEFEEDFIESLELIIKMDKEKFCNSIIGQEYVKHNPIKYYSDLYKCG
jgi:hypothetical protein